MRHRFLWLSLICFVAQANTLHAQHDSSKIYQKKIFHQSIAHAGIYAGGLLILNEAWYKGYPRTKMHSFDDHKEWLQVDKVGHGWTAYQLSRASASSWARTGISDKKATIWGAGSGWMFMTIIELLDAQSSSWGWSWSDMAANTIGSGLFASQQVLWGEQRLQWKYSFHPITYKDAELKQRAASLYGNSLASQALKNYNSQTYWLSVNLRSFQPNSSWPAWLNMAVGYGADGLWGGFENLKRTGNGTVLFDRRDIPRVREFYLAPDIDFTRIPTRKVWVKKILWCMNAIKCPAPTLRMNTKGKLRLYPLYF